MTTSSTRPFIAPIASRASANGPVTAARLRRTLVGYFLLVVTGATLALAAPPSWQCLGLGLMLPGGGFLGAMTSTGTAIGFAAALLVTLLLFAAGVVAWFGAGNIVAPIIVWIGAAVLAGFAAPPHPWSGAVWLLLAIIGIGTLLLRRRQAATQREAIANRDRRNVVLAGRSGAIGASAHHHVRELSDDSLALMRHVLDRALQPVETFSRIDWVDQFQFGSLRYALCAMGYALSAVQFGATPAFRGHLSEAQRRLHAKMLDHRVWKYWALENAWGNLSLDPNPIHHRDNIMYHGWYMAMLAEYISNTGDQRYNAQPMVLRHPRGSQWNYTFSEICEVLYRSHRKSRFTLFPCEPNWIYPMCNNFSAIALSIHDRLYGTHWWSDIEADFRRDFDNEFCTVDGRVLAIRSAHTGITLPLLTSAMADCVTAHFQHGTLPDIARRSWEIARMDFIRVASGEVSVATKGWDNIDTGNYRPSMITTYAQIGGAAAEMGDDEVAGLMRSRIRQEFTWRDDDGSATLEHVSTQAHAATLYSFAASANLRRCMHAEGVPPLQLQGPVLLEAPYPEVLVAYARNDGTALELVLHPGRKAAVGASHALALGQLRPGARYRCEDSAERNLTADATGHASLTVRLDGRTALSILPVQ